MSLFLQSSGLIRNDFFNTGLPPGYVASPPGRYGVLNGALQLEHDNIEDTHVLVAMSGACAIEITADYNPTETTDKGGLILFKNADQTIEFLESFDASISTNVSKWRAVSENGSDWDLFADNGYGYGFVDTVTEFDALKVGVTLKKGTGSNYVPLRLQNVLITKSNQLIVGNLIDGTKVELLNSSNIVIALAFATNGVALIDMPELLITGKIRLSSGATIISEISGTFYGGDRYDNGSMLQIVDDTTTKHELSTTSLTDIGFMSNGQLLKKLYIYNPGTSAVASVSLLIEQYNAKFGYQWADIALDVNGVPGTFADAISWVSIAAGTTVTFWIRVVQGSNYNGLDPLEFGLNLQHV